MEVVLNNKGLNENLVPSVFLNEKKLKKNGVSYDGILLQRG